MASTRIPVQLVRERIAAAAGDAPSLWRSLEELAGNGALREFVREDFPRLAGALETSRRDFLRLLGASLALGGAGACSRPVHEILPYARAPSQLSASQPLFFATSAQIAGCTSGMLVQSTQGRPTKIEGNPQHPASLGGTDIFAQASVLEVWDPDRSQSIREAGEKRTWAQLAAAVDERMHVAAQHDGAGLRVLSARVRSPTLAVQRRALIKKFADARWHEYEPLNRDNAAAGSRLAFGEVLEARPQFGRCSVVASLDGDFIGPPGVRHARDFMSARRRPDGAPAPNRLYVVEGTPTLTGAIADHRLAVAPSQIAAVAFALARALGLALAPGPDPTTDVQRWVAACARDLLRERGRALVVAGPAQPPAVHALVHAINDAIGAAGTTVHYFAPPDDDGASQFDSLRDLNADMAAGKVDTLIVLGGNPAYDAPADLDFAKTLKAVGSTIRLGLFEDETSAQCRWHVPQAHFLESWSDTRDADGTAALQQPLMAPLYGGVGAHALLARMLGQKDRSDRDIVRDTWMAAHRGPDFDAFWNTCLQAGVIAETQAAPKPARLQPRMLAGLVPPAPAASGIELIFAADPTIHDGRFSNNAWLQELPKPLTKLTWDNAALLSPALAARLDLANEDVVELKLRGQRVLAPVWIMPGQAENCVTVTLGYGRTHAGRVGSGTGFDAYALRHADAPWFAPGLEVVKTGRRWRLAVTQHHHSMEGREPVRAITLAQLALDPQEVAREGRPPRTSLYEPVEYPGYAWGMSINLDACIGCSACTIACQAENNIPVVGKTEVARGREMHWIRVDRYFEGAIERPRTYFQPVPCMHCERAPCEAVCPVEATVHDSEGLNLQVYNRCIGTRFCSNNCPYKVRRFNFLQYTDVEQESLKAQRNPEVTVRMRGVMEKCTFCVQRITNARIEAEKAGRHLRDGEVVTACQAACPTGAIVFGDLNDPTSRVNEAKRSPLSYTLLAELNTRPRTTYLARLLNPDPDLDGA